MIYFDLFLTFLKIGLFTFGGGYAMLPMIQEEVAAHGWLNQSELIDFIAVSESTPGPFAVNIATFVGTRTGGIFGGLCATLGVVLPSFIIIVVLTALLKTFLKNPYVQAVIHGIKPCIIGIVLATGVWMIIKNCFVKNGVAGADFVSLSITAALFVVSYIYKKYKKNPLSPIMLIILSAVMGIAAYGV
jgi:chromate transporter